MITHNKEEEKGHGTASHTKQGNKMPGMREGDLLHQKHQRQSIPVDPDPITFIPEADYDKFVMMDGTVQRGQAVEETVKTETVIGYRSHWATCPAAEDFRRKKNKSERTKRNEQAHTDD